MDNQPSDHKTQLLAQAINSTNIALQSSTPPACFKDRVMQQEVSDHPTLLTQLAALPNFIRDGAISTNKVATVSPLSALGMYTGYPSGDAIQTPGPLQRALLQPRVYLVVTAHRQFLPASCTQAAIT